MMGFLVYQGASVDAQDYSSGRSALHHAVENNQLKVASSLLFQLGADVDALTSDNCTPLHLAAGRGLCDMVALLIAAGADSTVRTAEDDLAVDLTRDEQVSFETVFKVFKPTTCCFVLMLLIVRGISACD